MRMTKWLPCVVRFEVNNADMTQTTQETGVLEHDCDVTKCPSIKALEYELAFLVRHLEAVRRRHDFCLERAHYLLLLLLEECDCQSVGCLAEQVNLDASTVTRQVAAMQRCGLVEKQPNPEDRRGGFMAITDKGREALEDMRQERLQRVGRHFTDWDEADRMQFAHLVSRFSHALSQSLYDPE